MEGFLDIRAPTVTHFLVTRVVNISPEMIIISAIGHNDMTTFLNI
jgi:Mn2+/Fe2+ NRAMP family transporter